MDIPMLVLLSGLGAIAADFLYALITVAGAHTLSDSRKPSR